MAFQGDSIYWVEVEKIVPNPFQPRREFDESRLEELAESIRMYGVLQPLTVTRNEVQREDGTFYTQYELIAGERRLRASRLAGVQQVPVIIRDGEETEQEKLELAIIENLQREDLNAVDRALAFKQLAEVFGLSHSAVAKKVGRSREYVSNSIRLLALPESMLSALKQGDISEGHARTLLMVNDKPEEQDVIFREILLKKLSVREVERIARKVATDKVRKKDPSYDPDLIEMEKRFTETLGTRVQIQKTDYGGKLTIDYFSVADLEGMLERMKAEAAAAAEAPGAPAVSTETATLEESTPLSWAPAAIVAAEARAAAKAEPASAAPSESANSVSAPEPVAATSESLHSAESKAATQEQDEPTEAESEVHESNPESLEITEREASTVASEQLVSNQSEVSPVSEIAPAVPEPTEPQSQPALDQESKEVQTEAQKSEPAATITSPARSVLADALAQALGVSQSTPSPSGAPEEPSSEPKPTAAPAEQTPATKDVGVAKDSRSQKPAVPAVEDEDLYSIRNFSI